MLISMPFNNYFKPIKVKVDCVNISFILIIQNSFFKLLEKQIFNSNIYVDLKTVLPSSYVVC